MNAKEYMILHLKTHRWIWENTCSTRMENGNSILIRKKCCTKEKNYNHKRETFSRSQKSWRNKTTGVKTHMRVKKNPPT